MTHWTWLVSCYLAKSVAQKDYHRLATRSSTANRGVAPGTHSETGASEPRGDKLDATEDLLVPVIMKLDLKIPKACLEMVTC